MRIVDFRFVLFILLGTIPAGVLGVLFNDVIEDNLTEVKVIGGALIVTGVALFMIRNLKGRKNDGDLTVREALIIGLGQAVALIPGISRSGATIVAGIIVQRFLFFMEVCFSHSPMDRSIAIGYSERRPVIRKRTGADCLWRLKREVGVIPTRSRHCDGSKLHTCHCFSEREGAGSDDH